MDSSFFTRDMLDCLEKKELPCIMVCRFNNRIKYSLIHELSCVDVADGLEISGTTYKADTWDTPRRIIDGEAEN